MMVMVGRVAEQRSWSFFDERSLVVQKLCGLFTLWFIPVGVTPQQMVIRTSFYAGCPSYHNPPHFPELAINTAARWCCKLCEPGYNPYCEKVELFQNIYLALNRQYTLSLSRSWVCRIKYHHDNKNLR